MQFEYNRLLDAFNARTKRKKESIEYLIAQGYTNEQAENAVHVYWKGGKTEATFRLSKDLRDQMLDDFYAIQKKPKECVNHLMSQGCSYRQATSAVYQYRVERGLIGRRST